VIRTWNLEGGERMNKKASLKVLIMGLLMLFAAVAPVIAAPATKVPASTHLISLTWTLGPISEPTPSGVSHTYAEFINERTLTIGTTTYEEVYVVGSMSYSSNPTTGVLTMLFKAVWYVGSLTEPTSDGFSVNLHQKLYYQPSGPPFVTAHGVWQGFGSFAKYTIKMEYEGLYPSTDLSGYCIIP